MERRRQQARRRLHIDAGQGCAFPNCSVIDPLCLTGSSEDLLCYEHRAIQQGRTPVEAHHPETKAIDPAFTVPMFGNDHRVVTVMSQTWLESIEDVRSSSIRKDLARLSGLLDVVRQLVDRYEKTPDQLRRVIRWLDETQPGWQQECDEWHDTNGHG